jgi:hypothetical protein
MERIFKVEVKRFFGVLETTYKITRRHSPEDHDKRYMPIGLFYRKYKLYWFKANFVPMNILKQVALELPSDKTFLTTNVTPDISSTELTSKKGRTNVLYMDNA